MAKNIKRRTALRWLVLASAVIGGMISPAMAAREAFAAAAISADQLRDSDQFKSLVNMIRERKAKAAAKAPNENPAAPPTETAAAAPAGVPPTLAASGDAPSVPVAVPPSAPAEGSPSVPAEPAPAPELAAVPPAVGEQAAGAAPPPQAADPSAAAAAFSAADGPPAASSTEKGEAPLPSASDESLGASHSLMLSNREEEWVRKAVKSYETKIPVSVMLPDLFPSDAYASADLKAIPPPPPVPEPTDTGDDAPPAPPVQAEALLPPPVAPERLTFRSFVRIGDTGWVAWMNGDKITPEMKYDKANVQIKLMSEQRLFFVWTEKQLERLSPGWKTKLVRIGQTDFYTNGKNVMVDGRNTKVGFYLAPGETFVPEELKVNLGNEPAKAESASAGASGLPPAVVPPTSAPAGTAAAGGAPAAEGEGVLYSSAEAKTPAAGTEEAVKKSAPSYMSAQERKLLVTLYRTMLK